MRSSVYMLDTNMAGYIVSGRSPAARVRLKAELAVSPVTISTVSQGEMLFGLANKPEATRLIVGIEALLQTLQILPWDVAAAEAYGRFRFRLKASGIGLSIMDTLIGAHAISTGAVLVTRDSAFTHARGLLDVTNWATDL